MPETIEIPIELTQFQLPEAVQDRLQKLLDRQDAGEVLGADERQESIALSSIGLVELVEFLSLLHLRSSESP
jgi:ribosome assembly protein YihI (activator of Der GTPase)